MDVTWTEKDGYFLVEYRGLRTLEGITAIMEMTKEKARLTGCFRYLYDYRGSTEGLSLDQKYRFGNYLAENFGLHYTLIALLDRQYISGFLENVSVNRGLSRLRILDDEARAVELVKSL
jgi:hypothetical protein